MITKEMFIKYLELQKDGSCNMWAEDVTEELGITRSQHVDIISNYNNYEKKFDITLEDLEMIDRVKEFGLMNPEIYKRNDKLYIFKGVVGMQTIYVLNSDYYHITAFGDKSWADKQWNELK